MPRQRRGGKNVKRSVPDISSSDGESGDELPTAPPAKKQRTISLPGCIRYWSVCLILILCEKWTGIVADRTFQFCRLGAARAMRSGSFQ